MIVVAMCDELKKIANPDRCIVTGVGPLNVYRSLAHLDRDEPILNFGCVGSNVLPVGIHVDISTCQLYHPNAEYRSPVYDLGVASGFPCYTSCDFVTQTDIKEPCVFDMELAFILAMGFTNVKSLKIVSDNLRLQDFEEFLNER